MFRHPERYCIRRIELNGDAGKCVCQELGVGIDKPVYY